MSAVDTERAYIRWVFAASLERRVSEKTLNHLGLEAQPPPETPGSRAGAAWHGLSHIRRQIHAAIGRHDRWGLQAWVALVRRLGAALSASE